MLFINVYWHPDLGQFISHKHHPRRIDAHQAAILELRLEPKTRHVCLLVVKPKHLYQ